MDYVPSTEPGTRLSAAGTIVEIFAQCGLVELPSAALVDLGDPAERRFASFHLGELGLGGRALDLHALKDLTDCLGPGTRVGVSYDAVRAGESRYYDHLPVPNFLDDRASAQGLPRMIVGRVREMRILDAESAAVQANARWVRDFQGVVIEVDSGRGRGVVSTELGDWAFLPAATVRDPLHGPRERIVSPPFRAKVVVRTYAPPPCRTDLIVTSVSPFHRPSIRTEAYISSIVRKDVTLATPFGLATAPLSALILPRLLVPVRERLFAGLLGAAVDAELVESASEDGRPWVALSLRLPPLPHALAARARRELYGPNPTVRPSSPLPLAWRTERHS